jgi:hypothetical protein
MQNSPSVAFALLQKLFIRVGFFNRLISLVKLKYLLKCRIHYRHGAHFRTGYYSCIFAKNTIAGAGAGD